MNIAFDSPWYLLLLVLAPIIWYFSSESLSGMGTVRRFCALTLRTVVLLLIVGSLAEIQYRRINDRLTVIYVLDQSESIPKSQRDTMLNFVKADVSRYRNDSKRDRAAVIVFGRDASIEVPPLEDDLPLVGRLESVYDLRPDATNLAQALKLALATFPEDSSRRIVVVSDGNENEGDARAIAEMMVEDGVGIDVVPIQLSQRAEIEVDKVVIPVDTRKGQPFNASVVLNNLAQATAEDDGTVHGKLRVWRRQGKQLDQ
ncbi:MAG: VWA domain-containing protein, partial [Pseudomonadales bacterium]